MKKSELKAIIKEVINESKNTDSILAKAKAGNIKFEGPVDQNDLTDYVYVCVEWAEYLNIIFKNFKKFHDAPKSDEDTSAYLKKKWIPGWTKLMPSEANEDAWACCVGYAAECENFHGFIRSYITGRDWDTDLPNIITGIDVSRRDVTSFMNDVSKIMKLV